MSSKSRNGLSKREYAAKASGGSLNYKTGKISTPKKSNKSSSSSVSNPYSKYQSMDWGSAAEAAKKAGIDTSTGGAFDLAMNQKYNPSNYETLTKKNSNIGPWAAGYGSETEYGKGGTKAGNTYSQREQAAKAVSNRSGVGDIVRKGLGIGTANASGSHIVTPKVDKTTGILGSLFMKGIEPLRGVYANLTGGRALPELGLSEALGLTEKVDGGLTYNIGDTPETDPATGNIIQPSNPNNIINTPAPYRSWDTFNESQGNDSENRTDTRVSSPNRSSRPVSNPISTPAPTPSLSDYINGGSPQSRPDFSAGQTTNPTRRQFLGNGLLSKGTYGNGAGDYGIEGAINSDMDNTNFLDDLLTLVGIKPQVAYAAEKPSISTLNQRDTKPNNYSLNYTPLFQGNSNQPSLSQLFGYTGYKETPEGGMSDARGADLTEEQKDAQKLEQLKSELVYSYDGQDDIDWAESPNTTPITNQSNTMAFNNIGYNSNPAVQQYQDSIKGFKTQEKDTKKAYKKALSEMLKGIEAQYAQSQAVGESDLNKQKVNDLQALSSRFSFGLNQDPNSEQAIQYQQRTANDYAGQLTDFLAKLAAAKTQDIASARSGNQSNLMSALNSISNQRNSAQEKLANLLYTMQQDAQSNALKNKPNLYQMASGLKSQGNNWGNIAYQLGNAGFDLTPGNANSSALDSIMTGQVPQKAANLVSIGNGYVMDKTTGDVFQAYDPNNV